MAEAIATFPPGTLLVFVVLPLILYTAMSGGGWLLVEAGVLLSRRRCTACNQHTSQRRAVGHVCEHCGSELAGWLFAEPALP